ncbi:MAG TPA: hypothetical protein VLA79_20465 [Polyangia bacterium]|nr:hypothetical protein [Polyangia bacterium]
MAARDEGGESLSAVAARLARRWANQRLAAVQSYGRILADYGQGHATSGATLSAIAKLAVEEAARYSADAVAVATDYAAAVARKGGVDLGLEGGGDTSRGGPATVVKDLEISGPLGGEADGEFYLTNPYDKSVAVSFTASQFTSPDGDASVGPTVEPAEIVLPAGGEQKIAVRAVLDNRQFTAGRTYTAHVAVAGFDHVTLRVRLTVLEPL